MTLAIAAVNLKTANEIMNDGIDKTGTPRTELMRTLRTGLQLIPFGIGSALDVQIFDRMAAREHERLNTFVNSLASRLDAICSEQANYVKLEYVDTDEFRYVLREVFTSAAREHRDAKVSAYRNVLLNAMHEDPRVEFDRKSFFLHLLESMNADHIRVVSYFDAARVDNNRHSRRAAIHVARELVGNDQSSRTYTCALLASLADQGLLMQGPAIHADTKGRTYNRDIDPLERVQEIPPIRRWFRMSELGGEFVRFISEFSALNDAEAKS